MLILLLLQRWKKKKKDPFNASEKRLVQIPASSVINGTRNCCFHYLRQHDETMSKCKNQQHNHFGASPMILFCVSFYCCTAKIIFLISCFVLFSSKKTRNVQIIVCTTICKQSKKMKLNSHYILPK